MILFTGGEKRLDYSEGLSLVSVWGEKTINGGYMFKIGGGGHRSEGLGETANIKVLFRGNVSCENRFIWEFITYIKGLLEI